MGVEDIVEAIGSFISFLIGLCIIFIPLGLWKLVEIIIWVFSNVSINW